MELFEKRLFNVLGLLMVATENDKLQNNNAKEESLSFNTALPQLSLRILS